MRQKWDDNEKGASTFQQRTNTCERKIYDILFNARLELDPPTHLVKRERRRDFISSRGTAESGFSLRAANRASARASSSGERELGRPLRVHGE
jgi:hypothetical protein